MTEAAQTDITGDGVDLTGVAPTTVCAVLMPGMFLAGLADEFADAGLATVRDDPEDLEPPITYILQPSIPLVRARIRALRRDFLWALAILTVMIIGFLAFSWYDDQLTRGVYLALMVHSAIVAIRAGNRLHRKNVLLDKLTEHEENHP